MAIKTKQYEISFDRRRTDEPFQPEEVNVVQVIDKTVGQGVQRFFVSPVDQTDALAFDLGRAILERFGITKQEA